MTLQWIRNKHGAVTGIAVMLGKGAVVAVRTPEREPELWAICELCTTHEAIVFCRTHCKYICGRCLAKVPAVHCGCEFLSMSVAREIAKSALKYAEVEA